MLHLLAATRQPFTSADARALGMEPSVLTRLVRADSIRRIGHGAFVVADLWANATPEERHLLVSRSVTRRYRAVALSHVSAVIAHRLPIHGVDLELVHLTRMSGTARCGRAGRHPPVQVHPLLVPEAYTTIDELAVCSEAVAVLQVADWHGVEAGLVAAEQRCTVDPSLQRISIGRARSRDSVADDAMQTWCCALRAPRASHRVRR